AGLKEMPPGASAGSGKIDDRRRGLLRTGIDPRCGARAVEKVAGTAIEGEQAGSRTDDDVVRAGTGQVDEDRRGKVLRPQQRLGPEQRSGAAPRIDHRGAR